jgi:ribonuclease-3
MRMKTPQEFMDAAAEVEAKLGYSFHNKQLLATAFTHCSYVNEFRHIRCEHNERLEYLGDSVLSLLLTDYLYHQLPAAPEGELTNKRSRLVDAAACLVYLQQLGVDQYLLLGRGEQRNDGRGRDSILSNLFEAIIGAIYLDRGLYAVKDYFFSHYSGTIATLLQGTIQNAKAELQNYAQTQTQQQPTYVVISESGPAHHKHFVVAVCILDQEVGRGVGSSKKEAQQAAAADALARLNIQSS